MKRNFYIIAGLLVLSSCQDPEVSHSENETSVTEEQTDSIVTDNPIPELKSFDVDLSTFTDKSYLSLFESSFSNKSMVIEPQCLSECPSISFIRLNTNVVNFNCGQDVIGHKIDNVTEKNDHITFTFEDDLQLDINRLDSTAENPFEHIEITLSDFKSLYMGYYEDSITSVNSDKLIMMLNNEQNRELLRNQNRWTALPCPEDAFD